MGSMVNRGNRGGRCVLVDYRDGWWQNRPMPRGPRLDIPGLLHHVIVRGVERRKIFLDDEDREAFRKRFVCLLEATGTECLAWCLLPNHFHLLLRTHQTPLATFMRRLLTGYAVTFNLRHRRAGHLFQNRYKSIVCEEEEYLLELVRYVHLNPLRAKLVPDMEALDRYCWSGHSVLMGKGALGGQSVEEILGRFGRTVREGRKRYREFVAAGVRQGRREELVGGGLRRSLAMRGRGEKREAYDERVLGSGEFVERLRQDEELRERLRPAVSLEELVARVACRWGLEPRQVLRRSTARAVADARAVVSYLGVASLGHKGTTVGAVLGLSRSGTTKAVARGQRLLSESPDLANEVLAANPGATAAGVPGAPATDRAARR